MNILALESSTNQASVAVFKNGVLAAEDSSLKQKSHSEFMNGAIANALAKSELNLKDIDLFAVAEGPGSFTGIRVSGNIAKTFSYIHKKPLYVTHTLNLLYAQTLASEKTKAVVVAMNAFKNMVYWCWYKSGTPQIQPQALPIETFQHEVLRQIPEAFIGIGDGYQILAAQLKSPFLNRLILSESADFLPHARTLGELSKSNSAFGRTMEWNLYKPLYVRGSEAEENLKLR